MRFFRDLGKKSIIGESIHIILNVLLALAIFALVYIGDWAIYIAVLLVLLSKWRVLAVRPRYWWANIQTNIVDLTVSISIIVLMAIAIKSGTYSMYIEYTVTLCYMVWLIFIKPKAGHVWTIVQSTLAIFLGVWALASISHIMPLWIFVFIIYIIGYGAARHTLSSIGSVSDISLLSMCYGLITAETAWLLYHWNISYGVSSTGDFRLSQMAIIELALALCAYKLFVNLNPNVKTVKTIRSSEVISPIIFSVAVIFTLLIVFSSHGPGII